MIGLINQPIKVYLDIATWKTLSRREISSGLAETIKHACIADAEFFEYLEKNIDEIFNFNTIVCEHIAERNCEIKYDVIMQDEKEKNLREILNLGHTVGRAIETVSNYRLLHGEALSIGMIAQVLLGFKLGYISNVEKERVINLLEKANLPISIPNYINREDLIKKLYTDKKVRNGKLRFVFQKGIGAVQQFENETYAKHINENEIREIIKQM